MFSRFVIAKLNEGESQYRAFTITVYCEEENLKNAIDTATNAAANAEGVIMAECTQNARFINGRELDLLEEVIGS